MGESVPDPTIAEALAQAFTSDGSRYWYVPSDVRDGAIKALGIDSDMPVSVLRRRLVIAERAEALPEDAPDEAIPHGFDIDRAYCFARGWNACHTALLAPVDPKDTP